MSWRGIVFVVVVALAGGRCARADSNVASHVVLAQAPRYTLAQCIDLALDHNADVQVARKRLEEAVGAIVEARAGFLPSLTSYGNFDRLQTDYATLGGTASNRTYIWNASVRLTESIYAGGAVHAHMDIARLTKQSRTLDYEAAIDQVILDVRVAFYDILRNQSEVSVHEQAVTFFTEQARNERAKLDVGTGQKLNVLRAEVNLSLEQGSLLDFRTRLRNSYLRLSELLSIPVGSDQGMVPFDIVGVLAYDQTPINVNDCLAHALLQRPELRARENEIKIQRKQLVVDRSEVLPHVDLFAGYDAVSEPSIPAKADYYNGYIAGVSVNWHVFDGLATKGRMNATRARMDAAEFSYDALQRAIEADVLRNYRDLQKAEENIHTQAATVQLAADSLSLAKANFALGLTTQLELLQSQLDLTRAQTAELSARFDYNAALARLQRAMGNEFTVTETRAKIEGAK